MNDDEYGALLLRPLAGEPAGPPAIDVAKAVRDGRRLRRRRWWSGGTALIAVVTATVVGGSLLLSPAEQDDRHVLPNLPPDPPVPTTCTAALLPMGGNKSIELTGADPTGRWQAGQDDPMSYRPYKRKLLVWHDGKLVYVSKGADLGIQLTDINSAGVGVGMRDAARDTPYLYRDGKLTKLKGGEANAIAINDAGMIAGELGAINYERPARWASPEAEPEPLALPPGKITFARVLDIAPDGTVVGTINNDGYVWPPDGSIRKLVAPPRPKDATAPPSFGPAPPGVPAPEGAWVGPIGFNFGWLYATVNFSNATSLLYRLDLASGTWQRLGDARFVAQVATAGIAMTFAQDEPAVWVGPRKLDLPKYEPAVQARIDAFVVNGVSDDAHVVSATAISGIADTSLPFQPIIWNCR